MNKTKKNNKQVSSQSGVNIRFGIKSIKLLDSTISQINSKLEIGKDLEYKLNFEFNINTETFEITLVVSYIFFFKEEIVHSLKVETVFTVSNMMEVYAKIDSMKIEKFNLRLIEIAIGATRGIQSTIINGTDLDSFYIPLLTQDQVISNFEFNQKHGHIQTLGSIHPKL